MRFARPRPLAGSATATVVVPCYNYGHHLSQLLSGVLDQPGVAVDVIIVDDCSPDGSSAIADDLAQQHAEVSVIHHQQNKGHIATYNDGLTAATGEYVVLLSADDLLPAGALARSVALMEAHPSVGLVYGYALPFTAEPPTVTERVRNWSLWSGATWLRKSVRSARSFVMSPEVVMRTAALREVGLYDQRLPHSADLDLWLRTALTWDIGRVNGPPQALYRVHANNMHLTTFSGWSTDLSERFTTFEIFYDEHAVGRPEVQALRPRTLSVLAQEAVRRAEQAERDGNAAEKARLLAFATRIRPEVTRTRAWHHAQSPPSGLPQVPRRVTRRVSDHLEWRWGRRYGT